jgi:hypothetical protein
MQRYNIFGNQSSSQHFKDMNGHEWIINKNIHGLFMDIRVLLFSGD